MVTAPEALAVIGAAITDPWLLIDEQDRVLEFNAAFRTLFPRSVARKLSQSTAQELFSRDAFEPGGWFHLARSTSGAARLDELTAQIGEEHLRIIVSALPAPLDPGRSGTLIVLRNVTDEARVQERYKRLVEEAERERAEIKESLAARTREVLAANERLNALERELSRLKRSAGGSP